MQPRPLSSVHADFDVPVTMRDGVTLRANVFRPLDNNGATYPVLLTRIPYGKDLPMGAFDPTQLARRGYIIVVQDTRGNFNSEGDWFPLLNETNDGVDSVAWAASLPGSNGSVGMFGGSYMGYTQWAAASGGSPALKALAPMITWADAEQAGLRDGVIELGLQSNWLLLQGLDQTARRYRNDAQMLGRAFYELTHIIDSLPENAYATLPLDHFAPLARFDLDEPLNGTIRARDDGDFSSAPHGAPPYDRIHLPAFHVGGWYDVFLQGTIQNFQRMRAAGAPGQSLIIGPWTHGKFDPVIGDINFGLRSSGAFLDLRGDLVTRQMSFFDYCLKNIPNGVDQQPAITYFVMGANVWKTSDIWPPANSIEQRWYVHSRGHANTNTGDGALSTELPTDEASDHFEYDPQHPVPTVGGATLLHSFFRAGPRDQRSIEARNDMLIFTSAPLTNALEVTGSVSVTLSVATDAPDTDFVARLVDVYADGAAIPITDGITRMRFRNGVWAKTDPLAPSHIHQITIDLWATSVVFLPGHRIRLDVTSSSFPRWERNLNTGQSNATTTETRVARQTLFHDAEHPSYLSLPVVMSR